MHNKALIADNEAAILGGRNIGDEYFGASSVVAFGDLDVLVHGPIVRKVSNAFDAFWNSESTYPIEALTGHPADPSALAALHAKTYVFDRQRVFIGSMNLDPRSNTLNTEIGVLCDSPAIAGQVIDDVGPHLDAIAWRVEQRTDANGRSHIVWIDTDANGTVTELDSEPDVSFMRRSSIWFLGLLPIESQL